MGLLRRDVTSRPRDLFAKEGERFFGATSRREVAQMIRWADGPRERAQAHYAFTGWCKSHMHALDREIGKVYDLVLEAGGEWWVAEFVAEFDPHGEALSK